MFVRYSGSSKNLHPRGDESKSTQPEVNQQKPEEFTKHQRRGRTVDNRDDRDSQMGSRQSSNTSNEPNISEQATRNANQLEDWSQQKYSRNQSRNSQPPAQDKINKTIAVRRILII